MEFWNMFMAILFGLIVTGVFVLGMLFAVRLMSDAQDDARYDRLREEYFMLAGFRNMNDPKPYVPPKSVVIPSNKTPRASRVLPGMGKLDRLIREGKRGTIMWRAEDRKNAG